MTCRGQPKVLSLRKGIRISKWGRATLLLVSEFSTIYIAYRIFVVLRNRGIVDKNVLVFTQNIHHSFLLPSWHGAADSHWAIIHQVLELPMARQQQVDLVGYGL